jgi:phosphate transport system permease protein
MSALSLPKTRLDASKAAVAEARYRKRKVINLVVLTLSGIAAVFAIFWLGWILWTTLSKGASAMHWTLFTQMTPPPGEESGGLANAIFGSVLMCSLATCIGAPIGVAAGVYLAEYANHSRIGAMIRFVNDILLSAPSIVLGLFIYGVVVYPMGGFSGFAGALALSLIMIPVVVRTTDQMLRLVPTQMREAALSLGIPAWKLNTQILIRAAFPGILTGILLALARIGGETAPLLFTALNHQYWSADLTKPMANLPVAVVQMALSPFEYWNALAWAGAFLITMFVLAVSLIARIWIAPKKAV